MAFIRPFKPEDTEDAKLICRATLPPTLAASPAAVRISPYLWTLPFTHLSPHTCFVLDDGRGAAVGYVIGTPDTPALAADDAYARRYVGDVLRSAQGLADVPPARSGADDGVRESWWVGDGAAPGAMRVNPAALAQTAYSARLLLLEGAEGKRELVRTYRAMLHINLLEGWRGKGWGRRMVERFVQAVRASGEDYGRGIQLGVSGENLKVVPFYERVGFRVYPGGEAEGCVWMVRDL